MRKPLPPPSGSAVRRLAVRALRLTGPVHLLLSEQNNRYSVARAMRAPISSRDGRPVLFVHNPKCAGSSLRALLGSAPTHAAPRDVPKRIWEESFSVVAVRDPVDRFVSGYLMVTRSQYDGVHLKELGGLGRNASPLQFLSMNTLLRPQFHFLVHPSRRKPLPDLILRFEMIEQWEALLSEHLDLPTSVLPHENRGVARERPQLDDICSTEAEVEQLRAALRERYALDFAMLGYRLP